MTRTIVIGGGAAGIAAARRLHDAGAEVVLLEASGRIGGRARSLALPTGHVIDAGCGWLHSARRNPWTAIAQAQGFTVDRSSPGWDRQWRDLGYPPAEQDAFGRAYDRWQTAARAALGGPDRPLSDLVAPDDPRRPQLDAVSGYVSGAPLSAVSLRDWAAYDDTATGDNWAVVEGYGTLEADRVIVAAPTPVITGGALRFDPPLSDKQAAADALPLGVADKAFLLVEGAPPWPPHAHLVGNPHAAVTASYRLSPFGWPLIEAFHGGLAAEALDGANACAFAIDELAGLLGNDWRARLKPLASTRWRYEPWIGGCYSYARPGGAAQRAVLAEPVDGRILFADEACSPRDFTTAHGAYQTGVAAADAVLAAG